MFEYSMTGYGLYDPFSNNCLHYVKELLAAADIESEGINRVIEDSKIIIPKKFSIKLDSTIFIENAFKEIMTQYKEGYRIWSEPK